MPKEPDYLGRSSERQPQGSGDSAMRSIIEESESGLQRLDGCCCGFLGGFATLLEDFALGADPILEWISGSAVALEVDFVSAQLDFLLRGELFAGEGFALRW